MPRNSKAPVRLPSSQLEATFHCSINEKFGMRLRTLRLDRGYTQVRLAEFLGIDRSFLSEVERGKMTISLSYLETIAQGFCMSLSELTRDL